jgi:tRNA A37 threonylcarbamoyladenosine biosynthesis protein TsaE
VVDLALSELVEERAVALVEWGDMAAPVLGDDVLEVTLTQPNEDTSAELRTIAINGRGTWIDRADDVQQALSESGANQP